jgi:hypothetical protein
MTGTSLLKPIPSFTRHVLSSAKLKDLLHGSSPLILSQCFTDMPAIKRWQDLSYFDPFSSQPIEVEVSSHDAPGYGERNETTLGEYLSVLPHDLPYRLYMAQFPLFERIPQLRKDVTTPLISEILAFGEVYSTSTWIGRRSLTPLHHDPRTLTNLFIQVCGRKKIRMFSPDTPRERLNLGWGTLQNTSDVDVWREHIGGGYEGDVSAGDGLIIPRGWWHSLRSDDEISMSVNWWFKLK